jgi:hypothetical protein
MAAYWIHAISWDLRDVPRLTPEEFRSRTRPGNGVPVRAEPRRLSREDARRTDTIDRFPPDESEAAGRGGARSSSGVPVFPSDPSLPNLWKRPRRTDL